MPQNFPFDIDIAVNDPAWEAVLAALDIGRVVDTVWAALSAPRGGDLSIACVDDGAIRVLNRDYRGKDKATNVLSFPVPIIPDSPAPMLGDIVLAHDTIAREADAAGKSVVNHCTHLLVHGFLHLQGYDHETDTEATHMETLETQVLASLGIDNPYEIRKAKDI